MATVVVRAFLDASVGSEVELASGDVPDVVVELSALGSILFVVVAPSGDAALVECPPLALGVVGTGDGVSPCALSAVALQRHQVPDADRVGVTFVFSRGLTTLGSARCCSSSPLAFGVSVTSAVGTPAEEALVFTRALRDHALIGVHEADVVGEVLTLLAALVELRDPCALLSGEASVGSEVDRARSIAESLGVIPHAERVVVALIALSEGELTGRDATVERGLETSVVVDADGRREDLAEGFALHEFGIPLALCRITRWLGERSPASVEGAGTSAVGDTSRSGVARSSDGSAGVSALSAAEVHTSRLSSASSSDSDEVAHVSAFAFRPHALRVGKTASFRGDLRTFGFAAADGVSPLATRISTACSLDGVGDGALGQAGVGASVPVADLEVGVAGSLRRKKLTSHFARSSVGVPHAF